MVIVHGALSNKYLKLYLNMCGQRHFRCLMVLVVKPIRVSQTFWFWLPGQLRQEVEFVKTRRRDTEHFCSNACVIGSTFSFKKPIFLSLMVNMKVSILINLFHD